jgi:hypothetical protein
MLKRKRRRPDDGRYLPKDALTWRRLVAAARRAAANPAKFGVDVAAKAGRAARAVPPPGHAHRESVFLQLVVKARLFWPATASGRRRWGRSWRGWPTACDGGARGPSVARGRERRSPAAGAAGHRRHRGRLAGRELRDERGELTDDLVARAVIAAALSFGDDPVKAMIAKARAAAALRDGGGRGLVRATETCTVRRIGGVGGTSLAAGRPARCARRGMTRERTSCAGRARAGGRRGRESSRRSRGSPEDSTRTQLEARTPRLNHHASRVAAASPVVDRAEVAGGGRRPRLRRAGGAGGGADPAAATAAASPA